MIISPILDRPTVDKIHLKTLDFTVKSTNLLRGILSIDEQGTTLREKLYNNSPICSVTIEPDKQGKECCKVYFNPNNFEQDQVISECRRIGIDFPILEAQVIRADFERHQQLDQPLISYHSIFHQAVSGRTLKTTNNQSFRVGTGSVQIEIYDKSAEAKLDYPNIIRIESRYLKPNYLQKQNVYTLDSLLNCDTSKLMQLYNKPKDMYLSNLEKLQGNRAVEQVGNYIRLFEQLHQTSNRPTIDFLQSICLNTIGIEQVLLIIQSADIPKRKRYNAKQYILKQIPKLSLPQQADKVKEILSYFKLSA